MIVLLFGVACTLILLKLAIKLFFPNFVNFIMKKIHSRLESLKTEHFKEAFDQIKSNNKNGKLEILELGIGTGENFKHFPLNSNITILDKTDVFLPFLKKSIQDKNRQDLTVSKLIVNKAENMHMIESNSLDAVVHTFILCSVDDPNQVLKEIYRVLKPGGVCVFIEHSIDNENQWRRALQKIFELSLGDCKHLDMRKILNKGSYDKIVLKKHNLSTKLLTVVNPIIYGYGEKSIN